MGQKILIDIDEIQDEEIRARILARRKRQQRQKNLSTTTRWYSILSVTDSHTQALIKKSIPCRHQVIPSIWK